MGVAKSADWQYYPDPVTSVDTSWSKSSYQQAPRSRYDQGASFLPAEAYLPRHSSPGGSFYGNDQGLYSGSSYYGVAADRGRYEQPQQPVLPGQLDWPPTQPNARARYYGHDVDGPDRFRASSAGAGARTAVVRREVMIIWDWDDTLMCSSAINANQLTGYQAQQLEAVLEQVLTLSMRLGETLIVTNADELWVAESTRRFCPRILPLLGRMTVLSARRKYERFYPSDVFAWKREAFREVVAQMSANGAALNLVVLGDSPTEMEAAQTSTACLHTPAVVKTVKFKEHPSADELLEQLHIVASELHSFVVDEKSGCRNLVHWMRPFPMSSLHSSYYAPWSSAPGYVGGSSSSPYIATSTGHPGARMVYATEH